MLSNHQQILRRSQNVLHERSGWAVFQLESSSGEVRRVVSTFSGVSRLCVGHRVRVLSGVWKSVPQVFSFGASLEFQARGLSVEGFDVEKGLTGLPGMGSFLAQKVYATFGEKSFEVLARGEGCQVSGVGGALSQKWSSFLSGSGAFSDAVLFSRCGS